jgi:hypothetical protein
LNEVSAADLRKHAIDISTERLAELLDPREAVNRKISLGGTSWPEIERQVRLLGNSLE